MTAVAGPSSADAFAALSAGGSTATTAKKDDAASADRFLKLLVTQMQNQDPLNPMDNAQVTSQMAQISTVTGITQLNTTVQSLNSQFVQMQALQGAGLVGHEITVAGNRLDIADGVGTGGFDLDGTASGVKVEVLNPSGRVVDTLQLGTQTAGRHDFEWKATADAATGGDYTFRVTATNGAAAVTSAALMRDHVEAINAKADGITLETRYSGDIAYADVKAFN